MIATAKRLEKVDEYYFSRKLAEVRRLDSPERRIINLGIGSPDLAPSTAAIQALADSASNPAHHGYQNYKGIPALREAIAMFSKQTYGVVLDPETQILPLMGSKEGIMHISMAFVNEGEKVLIPDPGYPTYSSVSNLVGATIETYPLNEHTGWRIDLDVLRKRDFTGVKLMWVNSPHMPTGAKASRAELAELVRLAREKNFLLVNDNPYSLILNDEPMSLLSVEGAFEVALELNSLSKSHNMAGWRIGWLSGSKEHVESVLRVKSNMDSGMFLGLQHAAVQALQSGKDWFEKQDIIYKARRAAAENILSELGCSWSNQQSGLFLWAKAPDAVSDVETWLDTWLYGAGVFLTPGFIFGSSGKRFVRISLCATEEKLREALLRIQQLKQNPVRS
ncbi:MAG: pyridoxal phosphate-dependent aminotransferase [Cyclobacteriaceae bacterium]